MAAETPSQTPPPEAPSSTPSTPSTASSSSTFQPTWQLPPGIEHHLEALTLKALLGGTVGAVSGALLSRRIGGGAAGMAFGVGCAMGSFLERGILSRERGEKDVDPKVPKFDFFK